jgi:hypothetical protein
MRPPEDGRTRTERREERERKRREMPKHGRSLVHILNAIAKRARKLKQ